MATFVENLITRRDAIAAELAAGETPDGQSFRQMTISVEGQSIAVDAYVDRLYRELAQINTQLSSGSAANWEGISVAE